MEKSDPQFLVDTAAGGFARAIDRTTVSMMFYEENMILFRKSGFFLVHRTCVELGTKIST